MSSKIKYLIPSISQALFVIIFLHLSLGVGRSLLNDCDTGFHIKAGEFMLDTRTIPKHDPFSLFSPPMPWPTHEWLSGILMATVHKISGLTGVVMFFIFMISISYSLLFRALRANKGNIFIDIFLIILVLGTSQIHWLARPHMFTLFLLIISYYIMDSFQNDRSNFLYILPPIMLFWINLHGGFVLGFILMAIYIINNSINIYVSDPAEKQTHIRKVKYFLVATIASVLISLLNPKGFQTFLFPFEVVSNHLFMDNYSEFYSPNFHDASVTPFRLYLLLMIAFLGVFREKLNFIELVLILVFTNMALLSGRYIPLFAVIVSPILSKHGNRMLNTMNNPLSNLILRKARVQESIDGSAKGYVWPFIAILVLVGLVAGNRVNFSFDEKTKPVKAVDFLKKEHISGNMFNGDEFGDYIVYSAFPQYKVFIDGRADIYGNEKVNDYLKVANLKPGWENVFEKYNINWIIFYADFALSQQLKLKKDWVQIYKDDVADIYVKNVRENDYLIHKFGSVKPIGMTRDIEWGKQQ